MWSDDELDTALRTLRSDVDTDDRLLARARTELLVGAGAADTVEHRETAPAKRHWPRWAAAAAAVAVVVAGIFAVATGRSTDNRPVAHPAAVKELNLAADRIGASDEPLGPGQYRYVATHAWWSVTSVLSQQTSITYLQEYLIETWVPADERQEWMSRQTTTGRYKWVEGSDAEAKANNVPLPVAGQDEGTRAPCGDFDAVHEGREPCTREGSWQLPDRKFMASLPRDATALFDRLRKDTAGRGPGPDLEMLVYAADMLRSGLVPADLRAALYRTLAMVPGLEVTEKVANLDGREGTALGIAADGERQDVIIDPATGQFIGEREVVANTGTVTASTSVTMKVVDRLGDPG
jgi:hypothetical protein